MIKSLISDLTKNFNIIFWIINYDKVKKKNDFQLYTEDVNWSNTTTDVHPLLSTTCFAGVLT